jgi:hypothetical protein
MERRDFREKVKSVTLHDLQLVGILHSVVERVEAKKVVIKDLQSLKTTSYPYKDFSYRMGWRNTKY